MRFEGNELLLAHGEREACPGGRDPAGGCTKKPRPLPSAAAT